MENVNRTTLPAITQTPALALPDAEAARRTVARWLRTEIGDALYPVELNALRDQLKQQ